MKTIFYSLFFIGSVAFSQIQIPVSNFTKITTFDQIDVMLIRTSGESKVVLNGAGSDVAEVVVKNLELKIRMPLLKLLKGDNISATVYYNTDLIQFEANEGSRISSNDYFHGISLRFITKEAGQIQLKVEAGKINIRAGSGSKVTLSGTAKSQEVVTNTGAIYDGRQLITEQTSINSNAGGDASVHATDTVDAKILAGGVITIYGDPKHVTEKVTGGGRIVQVK